MHRLYVMIIRLFAGLVSLLSMQIWMAANWVKYGDNEFFAVMLGLGFLILLTLTFTIGKNK